MPTIKNSASTPSAPGYPHPNPCLSFWLQGTRNSPLLGHRTTEALPENAEVVIIGSGLRSVCACILSTNRDADNRIKSGTMTAYFLLTGPNPPKSVLMLEAREACHGATSRNGGHCRPDCYRGALALSFMLSSLESVLFACARPGYPGYKARFGKEQALKIIQNEMDTLNLTEEIIHKEGIDCDFWRGFSYDVAMDQECAENFFRFLKEFEADGGLVENVVEWISDPEDAKKRTRCPSATAAAIFPAASLWPYKLVLHLLNLCILKYSLNLQTTTTVKIVSNSSTGSEWIIGTDRGDVQAQKVVYTTNAFTATLLPEFLGRIAPFRGQCSAIVPTRAYSGKKALTHTYSFRWGLNDYDYMIQRPNDGTIIIGGGRWKVPIEKLLGQTDDSERLPELTEHLKNTMKDYMEDWGDEAIGEGLLHDWTGIMGYTPEAIPYVGALHGKPGAFINAGHCGHGMARIMTCSKGLAALIRGETWESTKLPECFQPTPERLNEPKQTVEEIWYNVKGDKGALLH
ncbi:hypothetical protein EW146_g4508 [Bondarzewia mesenterica]|uniref:FAD dependent oxidoreductase domain-containing protein n=1 Tax=Bondarzewia mesenterica TaxID=1095465 RepID=A0A4S4LUH8_9AGAM|nr:hypothetical protein EW146_g4508 [Bondarzewia mesenterica]